MLGGQNHGIVVPYYEMSSMPTYIDVDPTVQGGQLLMDAGRILFKPGARLDTSKSIGFKSGHVYCVAPVVMVLDGDPQRMSSYDFWAVGTDCCSAPGAVFSCGEADNRRAAAGLRALDAGPSRAFYRLAVQEAEASFGITAAHPLFFHWMQDPVAEVNGHWDRAAHRLVVQIFSFCTLQLFVVLALATARAKAKAGA